jgi:hypothetical protein
VFFGGGGNEEENVKINKEMEKLSKNADDAIKKNVAGDEENEKLLEKTEYQLNAVQNTKNNKEIKRRSKLRSQVISQGEGRNKKVLLPLKRGK